MKHVFQPQSICYGLKKTAEALFVIYRFLFIFFYFTSSNLISFKDCDSVLKVAKVAG